MKMTRNDSAANVLLNCLLASVLLCLLLLCIHLLLKPYSNSSSMFAGLDRLGFYIMGAAGLCASLLLLNGIFLKLPRPVQRLECLLIFMCTLVFVSYHFYLLPPTSDMAYFMVRYGQGSSFGSGSNSGAPTFNYVFCYAILLWCAWQFLVKTERIWRGWLNLLAIATGFAACCLSLLLIDKLIQRAFIQCRLECY